MSDNNFRNDTYALVASIPRGRVMTYGDVAALTGHPYAARQVGMIAHYGPPDLPWQRLVSRHGGLASAYNFGGLERHKADLEADGVVVDSDYRVADFARLRWRPEQN